jgi:hypothetical protein
MQRDLPSAIVHYQGWSWMMLFKIGDVCINSISVLERSISLNGFTDATYSHSVEMLRVLDWKIDNK